MNTPDESGFNGSIERLSLVDLVQLACLEGGDRKLVVESGESTGTIYFTGSEIVHAEFGNLKGEEALYAILGLPFGTFNLTFADTVAKTIDSSWNFLLMEAVRRIDEQDIEEESNYLKVLVVDDSPLFTKAFVKLFEDEVEAKVIGTATNGKEALKFLERQVPDLVTLDINMPVMGGDVALKHIMIRSPAPVVLVSSFSEQTCPKLIDFMRLGAVDVVAKPDNPHSHTFLKKRMQYILTNVKEFQVDNVSRAKPLKPVERQSKPEKPATRMLLILSGMGGILELQKIIPSLEYDGDTAVLVLQNMYPTLTEHLATYLDKFTPYNTTPLHSGMKILGGQCRVGSWQGNWEVLSQNNMPVISRSQDKDDKISLNSEDLLVSAAEMFGSSLTLVILSGAHVGLENGLKALTAQGSRIILQNPDSCLVSRPVEELTDLSSDNCYLKPEEIAPFLMENSE